MYRPREVDDGRNKSYYRTRTVIKHCRSCDHDKCSPHGMACNAVAAGRPTCHLEPPNGTILSTRGTSSPTHFMGKKTRLTLPIGLFNFDVSWGHKVRSCGMALSGLSGSRSPSKMKICTKLHVGGLQGGTCRREDQCCLDIGH